MDDVAASSGPGDLAPVLEETSATTSIPLEDAPQSDISLIFVSIMNWWSSKIKEGESPAANRPQLLESRQDSKPEDSAKDSSSEEHEDDIDYCYLATQPDPDMIIEDDGWLLLDTPGISLLTNTLIPIEPPIHSSTPIPGLTGSVPDPVSQEAPKQNPVSPCPMPSAPRLPHLSPSTTEPKGSGANSVLEQPPTPDLGLTLESNPWGAWGKFWDPKSKSLIDITPRPRSPSPTVPPLISTSEAPQTSPPSDEPNIGKRLQPTSKEPNPPTARKPCKCHKTYTQEVASWMSAKVRNNVKARYKWQHERERTLEYMHDLDKRPSDNFGSLHRFDQPCCDAHIPELLKTCLCNQVPLMRRRAYMIRACLQLQNSTGTAFPITHPLVVSRTSTLQSSPNTDSVKTGASKTGALNVVQPPDCHSSGVFSVQAVVRQPPTDQTASHSSVPRYGEKVLATNFRDDPDPARKVDQKETPGSRSARKPEGQPNTQPSKPTTKSEPRPAGLARARRRLLPELLDKHLDVNVRETTQAASARPTLSSKASPGNSAKTRLRPAPQLQLQALPSPPLKPRGSSKPSGPSKPPKLRPVSYDTNTRHSTYDVAMGDHEPVNVRDAPYAIGGACTASALAQRGASVSHSAATQEASMSYTEEAPAVTPRHCSWGASITSHGEAIMTPRGLYVPRDITPEQMTEPGRAPWADPQDIMDAYSDLLRAG